MRSGGSGNPCTVLEISFDVEAERTVAPEVLLNMLSGLGNLTDCFPDVMVDGVLGSKFIRGTAWPAANRGCTPCTICCIESGKDVISGGICGIAVRAE